MQPPCIPFLAAEQLQRPALLEDTLGNIYLGFGALSGDESTHHYHGWLIAYSYSNGAFTRTMVFNSTQNATQSGPVCSGVTPPTNQCGHGGGIWMSGRGPALDSTGIYVVAGNGGYGGRQTGNWGESAILLNSAGIVQSSFTPAGYTDLNEYDLDLGDAGAILFSSTNATMSDLMVTAGKTGMVYVLNRASLGGLQRGNSGAIQVFTGTTHGCGTGPGQNDCYEIHNPAFWALGSPNPMLYIWAYGDGLRVWDFNQTTNQFALDPNQGTVTASNYPGGGLAVSSNGNSNGIVWGIIATTNTSPGQGALYAFNATNVSEPLFISTDYWFSTKFTIPTVANGKVYVSTSGSPKGITPAYSPQLVVYGLCSNCPAAVRGSSPIINFGETGRQGALECLRIQRTRTAPCSSNFAGQLSAGILEVALQDEELPALLQCVARLNESAGGLPGFDDDRRLTERSHCDIPFNEEKPVRRRVRRLLVANDGNLTDDQVFGGDRFLRGPFSLG